eukprot:scaffold13207_cov143-Cylindrotheca_fusiformis.AAC.10
MKVTIFTLAALATAHAESASAALRRRRLDYEKVAGYLPGSQVTDHCSIDLDQKAIEDQLADGTNDSFEKALEIYNNGGHSKSYAQVTLTPNLTKNLSKGTEIMGKNADGVEVRGKAYDDYSAGDKVIKIQYATTDIQDSYVGCQVGALVDINTEDCFAENGEFTIDGTQYTYIYDPLLDNSNGRTIAGFSTSAKDKMRVGCPGCPFTDFEYFYEYYGTDDYADEWVTSAIKGVATSFPGNGNADFSQYTVVGRAECAKKGTAYMNVFMYVIREMEDAVQDCRVDCIDCNDDPVHAWDEAVCFYTGSIEGKDGLTDDGKLLHQLADKRCENFKTCGVEGQDLEGTAAVNYEIFDLFSLGNYQLNSGNCPAARKTVKMITELMYIPLIQGTLRYAYKVDKLSGGEKEKAEGTTFAAAVLPRIHAADAGAAKTIYDNMKVGASSTNFADVKAAFESVYSDLGINCADIGGLWNDATESYFDGMSPCKDSSTSPKKEEDKTLALALGLTFGILFLFALVCIFFMCKKEKEGAPVFAPTVEGQAPSDEKAVDLN